MSSSRSRKWMMVACISAGFMFQPLSCSTMVRQSIIQGVFSWATGAVSSSLSGSGSLFSDVLLGLLGNQNNQN